jgi:chemotaxis protein histidine kinase CheA
MLNKMNEVSLDDFSTNFIESFIDIKDQIKTTYMQSDLSRPLNLEKSEWAELIVEIYKLSIIAPNKKVSNRDFDYAVKNILTIVQKFELMYLEKIISDFSHTLNDPEHTSFEDTTYAFSEMWKYISLVNYLEFSKVKSNDERETFYGEFEKIIEISKNENENLVRSKILELNHRLILHSVLDELSKSNIKVFYFFSEAKKWIGDLSPWTGGLIDLFLFKGDKVSNLSALRVELKTARIINNLPPRILEMAKASDPVASILSQFFIDKHYYYYLKLIDFFQLVDGFFTEKAGELGIKKIETWPVVMRNIKKLEKILERGDIEDIRKAVQRLKDIPIVPQISKFRSMVYDIALKLSKNVEFEIDGGDVSLDKESYNLLQDALVHILRNSLDHGIELPLERQELGKPAKGKIEVTCFENKKDDGIEIIVKDDGKGIDHEIIGRKAVEKGIFNEDDIKNMSKKDIIQIIFFPSFSQKDSVDELSGRGIGMYVVKENIKKLRGKIEVETDVGRGTTFTIQINPTDNS